MEQPSLNLLGSRLADMLSAASEQQRLLDGTDGQSQQTLHVSETGAILTHAYEQLRNAAEYTEDHLLLTHAIRRFYSRIFIARNETFVGQSGEDLITELTLAGYLKNDTVPVHVVHAIDNLAKEYYTAHDNIKKDAWTLDVLAVNVEQLLSSDLKRRVFSQFAYEYFLDIADKSRIDDQQFEVALFAAVQRALLKSDNATIRALILVRYEQAPSLRGYEQTNIMIDRVLDLKLTDKLARFVRRHGAPLKVLRQMIYDENDTNNLLRSKDKFLSAYAEQVEDAYRQINTVINSAIVKSVIFLLITKAIIGVLIEVPYDYIAYGAILWIPLIVNLLFPPIYMVVLRGTLRLPGSSNTASMLRRIEEILYSKQQSQYTIGTTAKRYNSVFNVLYGIFFVLIFGGVSWLLISMGFSIPALVIFFVFLSTASFLGFRLWLQVRELELVGSDQNGVSIIRDFLYIPFAAVGRWMSEKYAKINLVAMVLDMVIELPLKTILYLVRQWVAFIAAKKDEL